MVHCTKQISTNNMLQKNFTSSISCFCEYSDKIYLSFKQK
jgi:hypothetical protein